MGLSLLGLLLAGRLAMAQGQAGAQARPAWMDAPPTSTGLAVGKKIPAFRATDQNGKTQDFNSIRGPKGAVIMFSRSADW
ncbi:MAG TPA: hypothetical protein VIC04_06445 [Terriglobia bacterium]|jgi:hypothetical protein